MVLAFARDAGALYLLDATQAVGQFPVDVNDLGCDLLTGVGRKFLRGPRGTGFLWVRDTALERLDPFVAEIGSATWDGGRGFTWAAGARRFETWENSYVNIIGLGAAVQQALELRLDVIGDPPAPSVSGCGRISESSRASPPTTSARTVAPSSPRRSPAAARMTSPLHSAEPASTSAPPWPKTTRSTPKSEAFTPWSAFPRITTTPRRRSTEPSPP